MISNLWHVILYQPMVNALAFLVSVIPGGDVGLAVILLTIIVKLAIFPLSQKAIESQAQMNILAPELTKIKNSGASKEDQAKMTFDLYKKHKTNPFSGCLLILIQIPIIFALYFVFRGIKFDAGILYSFVHVPAHMNMLFLGFINIAGTNIFLAILAGLSQYLQAYYMPQPIPSKNKDGKNADFAESMAKSMNTQMKYIFPFLIAFITYKSGVIALYFITSNIFAVGQQLYAKRKDPLVIEAEKYNE